jgi:hypothetical protein
MKKMMHRSEQSSWQNFRMNTSVQRPIRLSMYMAAEVRASYGKQMKMPFVKLVKTCLTSNASIRSRTKSISWKSSRIKFRKPIILLAPAGMIIRRS